ncbi:DUF359 domain-containing protein [Candidatus Bathyarchaeota archaeon]|nr:DUF359 domain-containing protein [Candidatus Bathyarchaeota archaeon]
MGTAYVLPLALRRKLKKPLGTLIRGSFEETVKKFKQIVDEEKPPIIISVGDTVSKNLVENRISLKLMIIDNRVMRKDIAPVPLNAEVEKHVKNPSGTITFEALKAIKESLEADQRTKIVIDGEEDLLALCAILYAPENSFVVYGQPHEGMVVVKATKQKKEEVARILKAMEVAKG